MVCKSVVILEALCELKIFAGLLYLPQKKRQGVHNKLATGCILSIMISLLREGQ